MLRNHTGVQLFPLRTSAGTVAALTQGSNATFDLSSLPIYNGNLANYVPAIIITLKGILTQSGGTGVAMFWDNFLRTIIQSIDLQNAFHGRPIAAESVLGSILPIIEFIGNGGRYVSRRRGKIPAANGAYSFNYTFAIPLSFGYGRKPHHTAQLALFFKNSQLVLNIAAASVGTTLSPGSTLTSLTAEASAVLLPEPELRLGPGIEWVDYQAAVSSGQTTFQINDFGNRTTLDGTERGAGVLFHGLLTSVNGQPGPFTAQNLTALTAQYRGQVNITHVDGLVAMCLDALGDNRPIGGAVDQAVASALSDTNGFPYAMGTDHSNSLENRTGLLFFPVGPMPTADLELSKVQVVNDGIQLESTIASLSGTMHHLCAHVRSWTPEKMESAARLIVDSGLAQKVVGTSQVEWDLKVQNKQHPDSINPKKMRFFPLTLKPAGADE